MSEVAGSSASRAGGRLSVDLDSLAANYLSLASQAAPARCSAVVKANGYGLGMEPVARRLAASGCDCFFVASLAEGQSLRKVIPAADIYVLEGVWPEQPEAFAAADLLPVINSPAQLALWAGSGDRRRCIVQVDTGMSRLGFTPAELRHLAVDTSALEAIRVDYLMTHLACADEPEHPLNRQQIGLFDELRGLLPDLPTSVGNTAAVLSGHGLCGDLVRPGIGLYGGNPAPGSKCHLQRVATLEGRVLQIREVPAATPVGYGAEYRARGQTRLATLGLGYADGYPRSLGNRGYGVVQGQRVPVVGRVSMDSLVVDVTRLGTGSLSPGDFVQLLGEDVDIDELARLGGTISYELLTGLSARLERRYVGLV